jgi:hypothetical protein
LSTNSRYLSFVVPFKVTHRKISFTGEGKPWWEKGRKQNNKTSSLATKLLKEKILTRRQLDRLYEEWKQNALKNRKSSKK